MAETDGGSLTFKLSSMLSPLVVKADKNFQPIVTSPTSQKPTYSTATLSSSKLPETKLGSVITLQNLESQSLPSPVRRQGKKTHSESTYSISPGSQINGSPIGQPSKSNSLPDCFFENFNCFLTDQNLDEQIKDIEKILQELTAAGTLLVTSVHDFSKHFRCLRTAIVGDYDNPSQPKPHPPLSPRESMEQQPSPQNDLSEESKFKLLVLVLKFNWIQFIGSYFQILFAQTSANWDDFSWNLFDSSCENIAVALEILTFLIVFSEVDLSAEVYTIFFLMIATQLRTNLIMQIANQTPPCFTGPYRLLTNLFSSVSLIYSDITFAENQIQEVVLRELEECLRFYSMEISKDESLSELIRNGLDSLENENPMTGLSGSHIIIQPFLEADIDSLKDSTTRSVNILITATIDEHIAFPRRYAPEFSWIRRVIPASYTGIFKTPLNNRLLLESLVEETKWYKMVIDLYVHICLGVQATLAYSWLQKDATSCWHYPLLNVYQCFLTIANFTQWCKDPKVLETVATFFIDFIIEQLQDTRLVKSLLLTSKDNTNILLSYIARTMLMILHNLVYYYKPCIFKLKKKELMRILQQIYDQVMDFDLKTIILLIKLYMIKPTGNDCATFTEDGLLESMSQLYGSLRTLAMLNPNLHTPIFGNSAHFFKIIIGDITRCEIVDKDTIKTLLVSSHYAEQYHKASRRAKRPHQIQCLDALDLAMKQHRKNIIQTCSLYSLLGGESKRVISYTVGRLDEIFNIEHSMGANSDAVNIQEQANPLYVSTPSSADNSDDAPTSDDILYRKWTCQQVKNWLSDNNLNKYEDSFKGIDGDLLYELATMQSQDLFTWVMLLTNYIHISNVMGLLQIGSAISSLQHLTRRHQILPGTKITDMVMMLEISNSLKYAARI